MNTTTMPIPVSVTHLEETKQRQSSTSLEGFAKSQMIWKIAKAQIKRKGVWLSVAKDYLEQLMTARSIVTDLVEISHS